MSEFIEDAGWDKPIFFQANIVHPHVNLDRTWKSFPENSLQNKEIVSEVPEYYLQDSVPHENAWKTCERLYEDTVRCSREVDGRDGLTLTQRDDAEESG